VAELRRGIEGGVYYWLVHHGAEVGSGSVRGSGARREAEALDRLKEEEGRRPPPLLGGLVGPHGSCKPTGRLG
jgi:flavin-dependent dehydrogenase